MKLYQNISRKMKQYKNRFKNHIPKSKPLRIILGLIIIIFLIHLGHALTLDRMVQYKEIRFESKNWPKELNGYRIAFVSDIHLADEERLWRIRDRLNNKKIDLLLLGGDFFDSNRILGKDLEILSEVYTEDGIFGIEGNHDKYKELFPTMDNVGIIPLSNTGLYVREHFFLAGVEDLWNRRPNIQKATIQANPESFILLLSHNPDLSMKQSTQAIDLFLSGHTHGGQMNWFGFWSIGLDSGLISDYGTRFKSGWAKSQDGTPVFVSNGIGSYYPRLFARPQVIIFTMYHQSDNSSNR